MFAMLLGAQRLLTRDEKPQVVFFLEAAGQPVDEDSIAWRLCVYKNGVMILDGRQVFLAEFIDSLAEFRGQLSARASEGGYASEGGKTLWTFTIAGNGQMAIDGRETTLAGLKERILSSAGLEGFRETRQVTVADVLAAKIPTPTLTKVSFPHFTYKQAFPDAKDKAEVVIRKFHEAPMLKDLSKSPAGIPKNVLFPPDSPPVFPESLPPVEQRLPRNPAVVRGPDGIGVYGGVWNRCTANIWDLTRKVMYESFVRFDPSGRIQPGLAYKWEVSNGNRVYTFYLRKGQKWSDGTPFTTADLLWVCNVDIGSARWMSAPNWMQEIDGALLLYEEDILDWKKLASTIVAQWRSGKALPGRQIMKRGSEALKKAISKLAGGGEADEVTRSMIVDQLNQLFRKGGFYDEKAWKGVDFSSELEAFRKRGFSRLTKRQMRRVLLLMERSDLLQKLQSDPKFGSESKDLSSRNRLNLLLFRAAYRGIVAPAEKKRVKVEAVPDENGDDSHIIRFTFRKPNSIFLEKTATFMFYRGLFSMPRHVNEKFHPDGSRILNIVDVLDWRGFGEALRTNPVGKRLWERLDGRIRAALQSDPPDRKNGEPMATHLQRVERFRQPVIDAINKALKDRRFYSVQAMSGVDLNAEKKELLAEGVFKLTTDHAKLRRIKELLVREDLLRRVRVDGIESLGESELFNFNLMVLRAALSVGDEAPLAKNREAALNHLAANGPREYGGWVKMLMAIQADKYPELCPHYPTIKAWRIVSEPSDRIIWAVRNPYYYRVDPEGNQLPYLDAIRTQIETQAQTRVLKIMAGSVDFQTRDVEFDSFTELSQNAERGGYEVRLWANDYVGEVTFYAVQAHIDPQYMKLQDDPRFRHALSLTLNRQEIIDVVFKGLGGPAQWSIPKGSPYYNEKLATMSVQYDPKKANELLDAMGLDKRMANGTRRMWDGRPLSMGVNVSSDRPVTAVQMACKYWRDIGIDAQLKIRTGKSISRRANMGLLDIVVHKEGGSYFGPVLAGGFAPTHPAESLQWAKWVEYLRSGGRMGWAAPERIKKLERMWNRVVTAPDDKTKMRAWQALADHTADQLPWIGIMTSPGKVVVVKKNFKNVPKLSLAGWIAHDPGNSCPEAFFKLPEAKAKD